MIYKNTLSYDLIMTKIAMPENAVHKWKKKHDRNILYTIQYTLYSTNQIVAQFRLFLEFRPFTRSCELFDDIYIK